VCIQQHSFICQVIWTAFSFWTDIAIRSCRWGCWYCYKRIDSNCKTWRRYTIRIATLQQVCHHYPRAHLRRSGRAQIRSVKLQPPCCSRRGVVTATLIMSSSSIQPDVAQSSPTLPALAQAWRAWMVKARTNPALPASGSAIAPSGRRGTYRPPWRTTLRRHAGNRVRITIIKI
jgi:hypothetical protein